MPGASIVADQPTGAGSGVAGVARNDLWLSQAVNLSVGVGGNTTYLWELLRKPASSVATLATPATSTSSFTPDKVGTYRIRLTVNGGGPGNVQTRVFRARYSNTGALANRGWAYPAPDERGEEANYASNDRGWSEPMEFLLEDIRQNLVGSESALVDGATINVDMLNGPQFYVTLAGNRALATPSNLSAHQKLHILFRQDGTGGRTITPSADYIPLDPTVSLNSVAGSISLFTGIVSNVSGALKIYYTIEHIAESGAKPRWMIPTDLTFTSLSTEINIGDFWLDPAGINGSFVAEFLGTFQASSGTSLELRLYDMGLGAASAYVPVLRATLSIPLAEAGFRMRKTLTINLVASPGTNAGEIHNVAHLYEFRAFLNTADVTAIAQIRSAGIYVS